ncbi:MAG: FAD-dependent oxidoreductase [Candidatus Thermoplasmatota archaeon]|nr:FAD-dependent oxidoreductase [Candidatus Thermoplasmatota archaeon]
MSIVIIGSGAAGVSALETIRNIDKDVEIKIISKDRATYSLCALPYYISNTIKEKNLWRLGKDFYKKMRAQTLFGKEVIKVVPERNVVLLKDQKILYDKLLIATGSSPIIPKIKGIEKKGVFFLANLENSKKIKKAIKNVKRAVVIGAGSVGIECAIALKKLGVEVFVIELLDRVLPKMLDRDMGEAVKKLLEQNGIKVILEEQLLEITGDKKVGVVLLRNKKINCDLVVVSTGVKPNIELVRGTSIKTNIGIIVDKKLRTNIKNIYAAGDVAEGVDLLTRKRKINATWPNAIEQGKIAGYNLVGIPKIYEGLASVNVVNVFDTPVVALGLTSSEAPKCEQIKVWQGKIIKKIILKNNKIVGMQAIGELKNSGLILSLINKGADCSKLKNRLLHEKFAYPLLTYT